MKEVRRIAKNWIRRIRNVQTQFHSKKLISFLNSENNKNLYSKKITKKEMEAVILLVQMTMDNLELEIKKIRTSSAYSNKIKQ